MAVNIGNAFRDALLDGGVNGAFPAGSFLRLYTGSRPALTTDAASGTLLAEITLPATPWAASSGNSKSKNGTWEDASANASGTAGWARLLNAAGTVVVDFTVTVTAGGGDITMASTTVTVAKKVTINTLVLAA